MTTTQRFGMALDLIDEPNLIEEYERYHRPENAWPEVTRSIRDAGIEEMEIYRVENRLFMVVDANNSYDPGAKADADASNAKVREWEDLMSCFQQPLRSAPTGQKWLAMTPIYRLSANNKDSVR